MENFTLDRISATTVHDTRGFREDEEYPVRYRITFNGKQTYYPSGIKMTKEDWAKMPTTRTKELKEQRELILAGFEKIKEQIKLMVKGEGFSLDELKTRLSRGTKDSIISAFENREALLKSTGQYGTAEWYKYSKDSIANFAKRDLKFADITVSFLKRYEAHLLEDGKTYTSISMYMRALRAILNEGKRHGIISQTQYPFGKSSEEKYEIPSEQGRKMALTLAQIKTVLEYTPASETQRMCRDIWIFSYLCNGINMADLCRLRYSNISDGKISYNRQKTIRTDKDKTKIVAIMLPEMQRIIDQWGNKRVKADTYIFPFLNDEWPEDLKRLRVKTTTRLINKKMNDIGEALNLGSISTYTARHSFATVLKRSGTNIAFISESLGHSSLEITQTYLDSFEDDALRENAQKLLNF